MRFATGVFKDLRKVATEKEGKFGGKTSVLHVCRLERHFPIELLKTSQKTYTIMEHFVIFEIGNKVLYCSNRYCHLGISTRITKFGTV